MSKDKATFDKQSAERIAKATRWSESQIQRPKDQDRRLVPRTIEANGRYAKITEVHVADSTSEEPVKYSWICVEPSSDGSWSEKGEWGKGGPKYTTPVDLTDYFAVDSDNQGTIEKESIVLIKYLPGFKHVSFQSEQIVKFTLTTDMKTMDSTGEAKAVDSGSAVFIVKAKDVNKNIYGPAKTGFTGWAYRSPVNQDKFYSSDDKPVYEIIHMQRFARYIEFQADFSTGCLTTATVNYYWDGEDPNQASQVNVKMGDYMPCTCFGTIQGRAVYDEKASDLDQYLLYRVFDINQMLSVSQQSDCTGSSYICTTGTEINNLVIGKGLNMVGLDGYCCGKAIELENYLPLYVSQTCDGTATGDSTNSGSVNAVNFEGFEVTVAGDGTCTGTATVKMDLEGGDCITVSKDSCKWTIDNDVTVTGGNNCTVTKTDCDFRVDCDSTIGDTHIIGGECISVDGTDGTYTINNDMSVTGGNNCTVTKTDCDFRVDCDSGDTHIIGGECISVDGNDGTYTIDNDMSVTGGNGVIVSKSGCNYVVSLSGSQGDPKSTISYLCDVDISISPISITCVEGSGGWSLQTSGGEVTVTKSYGSFTIPSALISDSSNDCSGSGGSGGSGGNDPPPVYTCDDCPDCESGEIKILKDDGSECDCIDGTASMPEGWTECGTSGAGGGITLGEIDCEKQPPHFSFRFDGMPDGAAYYMMSVQGDGTSGHSAEIGPSYDHEEEEGQWYWGALCDGWYCTPDEGECFEIAVGFYDASGTLISTQDPVELCCE